MIKSRHDSDILLGKNKKSISSSMDYEQIFLNLDERGGKDNKQSKMRIHQNLCIRPGRKGTEISSFSRSKKESGNEISQENKCYFKRDFSLNGKEE